MEYLYNVEQAGVYFKMIYPLGIFDFGVNENIYIYMQGDLAKDYYKCVLETYKYKFPTTEVVKMISQMQTFDDRWTIQKNVENLYWNFGYSWRGESINEGVVFSDVYRNGEARMFYKNFYNTTNYTATSKNNFWLQCSFLLNEINEPLTFSDYFISQGITKGIKDQTTQYAYASYMASYINEVQYSYGTNIKELSFRKHYRNLQFLIDTPMLQLRTANMMGKFYLDLVKGLKYNIFFVENPLKVGFNALETNGYLVNTELKKENGLYFFLNNSFLFSNMYENAKIANNVWEVLLDVYGDVDVSELVYLSEIKEELNGAGRYLTSLKGQVPEYSYTLSYLIEQDRGSYENLLGIEEHVQEIRKRRKEISGVDLRKYMGDLGIKVKPRMEFMDKVFGFFEELKIQIAKEHSAKEESIIGSPEETYHYLLMCQPGGMFFDLYYDFSSSIDEEFLEQSKQNTKDIFKRWGREEKAGWRWEPNPYMNLFEYLEEGSRRAIRDESKFSGYPVSTIDYSVLEDVSFFIKDNNYIFYNEKDYEDISRLTEEDFNSIISKAPLKDFFSVGRNNIGEIEVEVRVKSFVDNSIDLGQGRWKTPVDVNFYEVEGAFYGLAEEYKELLWELEKEYGMPYNDGILITHYGKFRDYSEGISGLKVNFFDVIRDNNEDFSIVCGTSYEDGDFLESKINPRRKDDDYFYKVLQNHLKKDFADTVEALVDVAVINYSEGIIPSLLEEVVEESLEEDLKELLGASGKLVEFGNKYFDIEDNYFSFFQMSYEESITRDFYNKVSKLEPEEVSLENFSQNNVQEILNGDSREYAEKEIKTIIKQDDLYKIKLEYEKREQVLYYVGRELEKKLSMYQSYLGHLKESRVKPEYLQIKRGQILALEKQVASYELYMKYVKRSMYNISAVLKGEALIGTLIHTNEVENCLNENTMYFESLGKHLNEKQFNSVCMLFEKYCKNDLINSMEYLCEKCPEIFDTNFEFPSYEMNSLDYMEMESLKKLRKIYQVICVGGGKKEKEALFKMVLSYYEKKEEINALTRSLQEGDLDFSSNKNYQQEILRRVSERMKSIKVLESEVLVFEDELKLRAKKIVSDLNRVWEINERKKDKEFLDIDTVLEEAFFKYNLIEYENLEAQGEEYKLSFEAEYMKRFHPEPSTLRGLEGKSEDLEAQQTEQLIALGILERY